MPPQDFPSASDKCRELRRAHTLARLEFLSWCIETVAVTTERLKRSQDLLKETELNRPRPYPYNQP
jgi:hypothetical protein